MILQAKKGNKLFYLVVDCRQARPFYVVSVEDGKHSANREFGAFSHIRYIEEFFKRLGGETVKSGDPFDGLVLGSQRQISSFKNVYYAFQ